MIPPTPQADDLHGATDVVDSCVLLDFFDCHSLCEEWNGGAPADEAKLVMRCTRMRDALLLGIGFHARKARTYTLAYEPLDKLEHFAPPSVNDIPTGFVRATHLYVRGEILPDWMIINPDDGGHPEPTGSRADRELARVAAAYSLPLITLDGGLRKRATKAGVRVLSPEEYLVNSKLNMRKEFDAFDQRYRAGIAPYVATQPDPEGVEKFLRWVLDELYRGAFLRAPH